MTPASPPVTIRRRSPQGAAGLPGSRASADAAVSSERSPSANSGVFGWSARWYVLGPLLVVSIGLLAWSFVRLGFAAVSIQARDTGGISSSALKTAPSPHELATWRERLDRTRAFFLKSPDEILPALTQIETAARARGWQLNVTLRPALPPLPGFDGVVRVPVLIRFDDLNRAVAATSATERLISILEEISGSACKIDLVRLTIRSNDTGSIEANAELQFWLLTQHEKTTAK